MLVLSVLLLVATSALAASPAKTTHAYHPDYASYAHYQLRPELQPPKKIVPKAITVAVSRPSYGIHNRYNGLPSSGNAATARILHSKMEVNPDGTFYNEWSSDNGISVQEQATLKRLGDINVAVQQGIISYINNEGKNIHLTYVADENGFHPDGEHLPTPPPIPAAIARSLEYNAAHRYDETINVSR